MGVEPKIGLGFLPPNHPLKNLRFSMKWNHHPWNGGFPSPYFCGSTPEHQTWQLVSRIQCPRPRPVGADIGIDIIVVDKGPCSKDEISMKRSQTRITKCIKMQPFSTLHHFESQNECHHISPLAIPTLHWWGCVHIVTPCCEVVNFFFPFLQIAFN